MPRMLMIGALVLSVSACGESGRDPGAVGIFVGTAHAATGADPNALAKACLKCHEGEYSLSGVEARTLVMQIKAIRAGTTKHPPGTKGLTDAQIEAIAAILGKK